MSSFPVLLTGKNQVNNSTYVYTFPTSVNLEEYDVSVGNVSLFYSWFSISDFYNNNQFSINFPNGASNTTYNISIPNGTYSVSDLNTYLEYFFFNNGLYLQKTSDNTITYYMKFVENSSAYRIQLLSYPLPTTLPAGYTAGAGIVFPTVSRQPQLVVSNIGFSKIIGFSPGTYPTAQTNALYTQNGDLVPELNPIQSIVVNLNCISNPLSTSNQVLHVFTAAGVDFGSIIESKPNFASWTPCGGTVSDLTVRFTDQSFNPLQIQDKNLTIKLLFKKKQMT